MDALGTKPEELSEVEESPNMLGVDVHKENLEQEEAAIKSSCEHMGKFIDELTKCNPEEMSGSSKQHVMNTQKYLQKLMKWQEQINENQQDKS